MVDMKRCGECISEKIAMHTLLHSLPSISHTSPIARRRVVRASCAHDAIGPHPVPCISFRSPTSVSATGIEMLKIATDRSARATVAMTGVVIDENRKPSEVCVQWRS